jgi:hypothetical protein
MSQPSSGWLLFNTQANLNNENVLNQRLLHIRNARFLDLRLRRIEGQLAVCTIPDVRTILTNKRTQLERRLLHYGTSLLSVDEEQKVHATIQQCSTHKGHCHAVGQNAHVLPAVISHTGHKRKRTREDITVINKPDTIQTDIELGSYKEEQAYEEASDTETEYDRGNATDAYYMSVARARSVGRRLSWDEVSFVKDVQARSERRLKRRMLSRIMRLHVDQLSDTEKQMRHTHELKKIADNEVIMHQKREEEEITRVSKAENDRIRLEIQWENIHRHINSYRIHQTKKEIVIARERYKEYAFASPDIMTSLVCEFIREGYRDATIDAEDSAELNVMYLLYSKQYRSTGILLEKLKKQHKLAFQMLYSVKPKNIQLARVADEFESAWRESRRSFEAQCETVESHMPHCRAKAAAKFICAVNKRHGGQ